MGSPHPDRPVQRCVLFPAEILRIGRTTWKTCAIPPGSPVTGETLFEFHQTHDGSSQITRGSGDHLLRTADVYASEQILMKSNTLLVAFLMYSIGCSESKTTSDSKNDSREHIGDATVDNQSAVNPADARASLLTKLIEDHEAASEARIESVRLAADDAEKFEVAHEAFSKQNFPQQFFDFAVAADDAASLDACRYVISKFSLSKLRYAAIDHVVERHLDKVGIDEFFMAIVHGYALDPAADDCLKSGMTASTTTTRAHATYQLALLQIQRRDWCLDSLEERQNYVDSLGNEFVDHLLSDEGADEIAGLLEQVITEYPDERYFDYSISKRAEQSLFTLRSLEVGCEVPAIVGKDSAGRELNLRDQTGNVVVVCFWAHWCGICMESLPRETAFVSSMKNRPFVWLGVNGDDDIGLLREAESSGSVNFKSWHDGREGAIATQWNIWGFPSLFVIDHEGIIRFKSRGYVDLDIVIPLVEELVTTLEAERTNGITPEASTSPGARSERGEELR